MTSVIPRIFSIFDQCTVTGSGTGTLTLTLTGLVPKTTPVELERVVGYRSGATITITSVTMNDTLRPDLLNIFKAACYPNQVIPIMDKGQFKMNGTIVITFAKSDAVNGYAAAGVLLREIPKGSA